MRVVEKRGYEIQLTPVEAQEFENVINLLDDLHLADYFTFFRDEIVDNESAFYINSFKDLGNLLATLLKDVTVSTLA